MCAFVGVLREIVHGHKQDKNTQVYSQLTTAQLVLLLLHVSTTNRSHLQGATSAEDNDSVL
jgi:hypothetical protein